MDKIHTIGKYNIPEVILDKDSKRLFFGGKSMPEDANAFFAPIIRWFDEYEADPNESTVVEFKMEYFNTSSLKKIIEILNRLKNINDKGNTVLVKWYYTDGDDDMLDTGKAFEEFLRVPFIYEILE